MNRIAWACWVDGSNPEKNVPQLENNEPLAYEQRTALIYEHEAAALIAEKDKEIAAWKLAAQARIARLSGCINPNHPVFDETDNLTATAEQDLIKTLEGDYQAEAKELRGSLVAAEARIEELYDVAHYCFHTAEVFTKPLEKALQAKPNLFALKAHDKEARKKTLEEIASWYAEKGWLLDEDDVPEEIRRMATDADTATVRMVKEMAYRLNQAESNDKEVMAQALEDAAQHLESFPIRIVGDSSATQNDCVDELLRMAAELRAEGELG